MARLSLTLTLEGRDIFMESVQSILEACSNAGRDDEIVIESGDNGFLWNGVQIGRLSRPRFKDGQAIFRLVPAVGIVQIVAWVQSFIVAEVEWVEGWPILTTRPRDDGEDEPEPIDLAPDKLEPVA